MLIALGFKPIKAASVALVANTAPVAFGAIAIPIVTLSQITGMDKQDLGSMVGRQTPFLALLVPFILVFIVDGMRGVRQTWPVVFIGGFAFALGQFLCSNYLSVELTDVVASLASVISMVGFLQIWQPSEPLIGEPSGGPRPAVAGASVADPAMEEEIGRRDRKHDTFSEILRAYAPYLIIIVVFSLAQLGPIKTFLADQTQMFQWPGLHVTNNKGEAIKSLTFKFDWLAAAGSLLLICGVLTMLVLRVKPRIALTAYRETLDQLKWAILTVASVLALAYVMNLSGQTVTIGLWAAGAGSIFALISPAIGWLGTAITGSDTSSNSLFGALQVAAAKDAGLDPLLLAASNSSGGVLGKMISPQNLAIGAAAVGMGGQEGELFRKVLKWSLLLIVVMMVLAYLQSTSVLSWMVP
jgi:lactate permease